MKHFTKGLFLSISLFAVQAKAQDLHFSQYYNAPLTINPANTGAIGGDLRAIVNYKDQWKQVTTNFRTLGASFDMKMMQGKWKNGSLGWGLNVLTDKGGDSELASTRINLSFAGHRNVGESHVFSLGLQGGFGQRSINYSNLTWATTEQDPTTMGSTSQNNSELGAGLLWSFSKGEMYSTGNDHIVAATGLSVSHINRPNISFSGTEKLDMKILVHNSTNIGIPNSNLAVIPGFMFASMGKNRELMVGSNFRYTLRPKSEITGFVKSVYAYVGAHYRVKDAAVVFGQIEIGDFTLGMSYDVNASALKTVSNGRGGFEISLRYINSKMIPDSKRGSNKNVRFM